MAYSLDRGRRSPYRQDRYTFHRGRPPMSGPGQPGVNVVGHGRHPMMSAGNVYAQQPRPGMSPQGNMMMTSPSGMMSMPVPMQQQPAGFNQQQMMPGQMQPGQMPPQGYYIQQPNQPMPQFQPPPYSQVAPYGQQNFNIPMNQMPIQMQPQNMTEEQKKEFEKRKKEMYFHEQQLKLKALSQQGSVGGWGTSNLSSLENMMGMFGSGKNKKTMSGPSMNASKSSVPSKQEMPTPTASAATPQADDDGFGDFMAGPTATSSQNTAMSVFQSAPAPSAGHTNISTDTTQVPLPTPASQPSPKVEEKQDLESLMLESITDMSAPQKAKKTFKQKTALKDTQGQTKTQTTAFSESSKARKWDNTEDLSDMFIVPTPAPPQPPEEAPTPAAQNTLPLSVNTTGPAAMQGQITPPSPAALSSSGQGSPSTYTPPAWCRNEANLPMVYRHVLEATIRNGVIDTELLYPILVLSGLDRAVLGHVWGLCNRTTPGVLTKDEMYMSLALIAIAQSGQTQNLTIEALYNMPHPPAPTLTPPGTASPNTPVSVPSSSGTVTPATPTAVTPVEAPPAADDDFAPFQEAPPQPQATGLTTTAEPSLARSLPQPPPPQPQSQPQPQLLPKPLPPPSSSGLILLPPPPPPPPAPPSQYSFPAAAADIPEDIATPSPAHSASSIGSAGGMDMLDDRFSAFHTASDQDTCSNNSIPSGCMYPPLSSEDEYADFKSGDSSSSSSMSSSRASSQTSSSQNTDPEFPGFPRVGQPDVFPDLPTSGSSSPSSIRYPGILGGKALKLSRESPTFEHRKYSSRQSSKQSLEGNLPPVRAPGLTPSKFGPVRDSEDDEFADFQQASSSGQQFSGLREPSKISAPPTFQAKFPIATPVSQQDEEFADFQTAEQPKETSEDLFKFDEEDKYAALRSLSLDVQDTESVNEFADFKKSDEQDEFADLKNQMTRTNLLISNSQMTRTSLLTSKRQTIRTNLRISKMLEVIVSLTSSRAHPLHMISLQTLANSNPQTYLQPNFLPVQHISGNKQKVQKMNFPTFNKAVSIPQLKAAFKT
ncbi:synergin gamma-like isoform X2 [Ptychodera flava]|uniref:synergin gamma-like isoform X2 n=1 Tax=Ptychodera flava TaxID=63121 RepID=UPI003969FCF9